MVANSATVVILGDVQTLVEAVFDTAKTRPVQLHPLLASSFSGGARPQISES